MPTPHATWYWQDEHGRTFGWDLDADRATLTSGGTTVWRGSLLPAFWLRLADGTVAGVKAEAGLEGRTRDADRVALHLTFGEHGCGELHAEAAGSSLRVTRLEVEWNDPEPAVVALYFGASPLTGDRAAAAPTLDQPLWPDWHADGFCVPGAKGAPLQSFFRCWDLGHATLPLGNFGPSLGTPYAAAFPRPLFAAALGGEAGWLVAGAGSVPDAALTFDIRSSAACVRRLYREDLWGAGNGRRGWDDPLWLFWADDAWNAYQAYFSAFEPPATDGSAGQVSHLNSWGDFKQDVHDLPTIAARADDAFAAKVVSVDDGWERADGSGRADEERFPHFDDDLAAIRARGMAVGLWIPVGWVLDPGAAGLSDDDLLCGADGRPRLASWNWSVDDGRRKWYCLDPSSPGARAFVCRRITTMIERYDPALLKLDFAYGLPSPDAAVARDPDLRGERMADALLRLVAETARGLRPRITLQYYSPHPLVRRYADLLALDDLGDAGTDEAAGHGQWSVWAALAADGRTAITASSGYDWGADSEVLLDTAVLGAPGAVLPSRLPDGSPVPPPFVNRRRAIGRWHRRTTAWRPLWLSTAKGAIGTEPRPRCWGRLERDRLTALALREAGRDGLDPQALRGIEWEGDWAVITQDAEGIFASREVACVPFTPGRLRIPFEHGTRRVTAVFADGDRPVDDPAELVVPADWLTGGLLGLVVRAD